MQILYETDNWMINTLGVHILQQNIACYFSETKNKVGHMHDIWVAVE